MMSSCTRKKLFAYLGIWLLVACFFLLDIHFGENTSATGGVFSIHFDCYGLDADELEKALASLSEIVHTGAPLFVLI